MRNAIFSALVVMEILSMFILQVKNEEISTQSSFATGQHIVVQRPANVNIKMSMPFCVGVFQLNSKESNESIEFVE